MKASLCLLARNALLLLTGLALQVQAADMDPMGPGPYPVGNTNFQVTEEFSGFNDQRIRDWLAGFRLGATLYFFNEHLAWPDDAWVIEVEVPNEPGTYSEIAGRTIPVVIFLSYPTTPENDRPSYQFPFPDSDNTVLRHMQGPGEAPLFADPEKRYPLVLISHGRNVHGIWEIDHAQRLASHGYIALTMNYGDPRIYSGFDPYLDTLFRPLAARTALDQVLASEEFGKHIDRSRIAVSGTSAGGHTSLALAGGRYLEGSKNFNIPGVSAVVAVVPWVGGSSSNPVPFSPFGTDYTGLKTIKAPVLGIFATLDTATPGYTILPALQQVSGPRYIVEFVDQPHIFEGGSWDDLAAWELLFLDAYIKNNPVSRNKLSSARSMRGGNEDIQHFDRQSLPAKTHQKLRN